MELRSLDHTMKVVELERLAGWTETWAQATVFGLVSVAWTYAFVAILAIPLWPAFLASATYFAADDGITGLRQATASTLAGIAYAAATLAIVDAGFGGSVLALSVVVGAFMLLASLHAAVPLLSFTPGGFVGYATMFSVHAASVTVFGVVGLPGETLAAGVSMGLGAVIGIGVDELSSAIE